MHTNYPMIQYMHLLLVEDELALAEQIITMLRRSNYAVTHVTTGHAAMLTARSGDIDASILDLGLPDIDGLQLLKQLQQANIDIPTLILTARNSLDDRVLGLDRGAEDYLAKPFAEAELLARLRVITRRYRTAQSSMLTYQDVSLDISAMTLTVAGCEVELSRKELMILRILLESQGRVISKEKITNSIYEYGEEACSNAIEVHISNLRKKLPDRFITTLRGLGYTIK